MSNGLIVDRYSSAVGRLRNTYFYSRLNSRMRGDTDFDIRCGKSEDDSISSMTARNKTSNIDTPIAGRSLVAGRLK